MRKKVLFLSFQKKKKKSFKNHLTRLVDREHLVEVEPRPGVEHEHLFDTRHHVAHALVADVECSGDDLVVLAGD